MDRYEDFDLTYVTIDSLSEGVGSSQISPLLSHLSESGLRIKLISYEKLNPSVQLKDFFVSIGVDWDSRSFGSHGLIGGLVRLNDLRNRISRTRLIHARSDIAAVASVAADTAPVLWDVRSLWADQKIVIQKNLFNSAAYPLYRGLEGIAARKSLAMSTLTSAVVPILEQRHKRLPALRTVVPTTVNLERFKLNTTMPTSVQALFSGTFNDYYDLELSRLFMQELRQLISIETHWARPAESHRSRIGVGESKVFLSSQIGMAELIPNYSFGVAVCRLDSGPSLTAAMPTKIGEFLASGRPMVVNKGLGDMDQFIEEFDAGVILDGSKSNLVENASKLAHLIMDPETPLRCRALAEKYFSMEKGAKKYLDLYSQMLNVSS
jgi:hypothetical protein